MKKRLKKKQYQEYVTWILGAVSMSPRYRQLLRDTPANTEVNIDLKPLEDEIGIKECISMGLQFCAYRTEFDDPEELTCKIIVKSAEPAFQHIRRESYNWLANM